MIEISRLMGLWRRSLIAWPDGREDATTTVYWLQGPGGLYADLRQPAGRPAFDGVTCLRALGPAHLDWLGRQQGFAGEFGPAGACFEWQRAIDYQPETDEADAGRLTFEGAMLIEAGRDAPYVEHWHRESPAMPPLAAARLREAETGRPGILVRVGARFMYVRGRCATLARGGSLADRLRGTTLATAQDMVDCEISLGTIDETGWLILRSSLPFREGHRLDPRPLRLAAPALAVADVDADGAALSRAWQVCDLRGALNDLAGPLAVEP